MPSYRTLVLSFVVLAVTSCGDDGPSSSTDGGSRRDAGEPTGPSRAEVLAHLGAEVVLPTYRDFVPLAEALVSATDSYAAGPSPDTRAAAQDAWAAAMDVWQEAEMMQLGPLAPADLAMGGEDFRNEIYAWPQLNLCVVDQRTVGPAHDDPTMLSANPINERGLGAIEYLLFVEGSANTCSPLSGINADGTWAMYTAAQIEQRRARLAHSYAVIVRDHAQALVDRWEGGGFLAELTDPTRSGALYGSAQEGLNAVSDAMFYLDKETKDMKVAQPASIGDCTRVMCGAGARESRFANRSKEHVVANLRAFQRLYLGGDPGGDEPGFDDLLAGLGAEAFAAQMATHIEEAITAVEAIPGTLGEALTADIASVMAAHAAIRVVTDDLKTMFLTVLDLEIPDRAAGDTD